MTSEQESEAILTRLFGSPRGVAKRVARRAPEEEPDDETVAFGELYVRYGAKRLGDIPDDELARLRFTRCEAGWYLPGFGPQEDAS